MSNDTYDDIFGNWPGSRTNGDSFKNPVDYWCTSCGTSGLFLWDEDDLDAHGYTMTEAPHGICVGCARIDEKSGEMIDETVQDPDYFSIVDGQTAGTILTHRNLTPEQLEQEEMRTPFSGRGEDHRVRYRIKSLYRSAIKDDRYYKLNPPYFVGNRKELMLGSNDSRKSQTGKDDNNGKKSEPKEVNTNKKKSETDVEKYTYIQTNNDWFLSLFRSFKLHEDYLKNFSDREKRPRPRRGGYALMATYLHKSYEWNHIEPIWYFMKRMNFSDVQMRRRMENWIQPLPDYHLTQIEHLPKLEPNVNTIDNIISLLGKSENLTLSSDEISELKSQSKSALKKLQKYQYDDNLSLLEFLNSRCEFGDSFSIGGKVIHAAGMIEALCINYSASFILSETKANVLSKTLFPGNHAGWWWKDDLSEEAIQTFEDFNDYFTLI